MLDDIDLDIPEKGPPRRSGNQIFRLIAGILGVILLLALIAAAIYVFIILPDQTPADLPQDRVNAGLTETAEALAQQDEVAVEDGIASPSPSPTQTATSRPATSRPATQVPTATEITPIFTAVVNGETATVNALLTQAALSQTEAAGGVVATVAATSTASSTLPDSGFADDVGLPGLLTATALLLAVILLARRMRAV